MTPEPSAAQDREFCPTCGSALAYDKSGHILYGGRLSFRDFEQILLSLGASGSDVRRLWPKEVPMHGYWHKPRLYRVAEGGDLLLGPVQFNWFNDGFRVHFTWPFKTPRTVTLWQK